MQPVLSKSVKLIMLHGVTYSIWAVIFFRLHRQFGQELWHALGLKVEKPVFDYIYSGLLCSTCIFGLGWFLGHLAVHFDWPIDQPYQIFSTHQLKLIAVLAILIAPIVEEIIFRDFLQVTLYRYMKPSVAIMMTALLFTLFHSLYYGHWLAMVYVTLLGLLLGTVRYRTQSTLPCIIGHFLNNLVAAVVLLS